MDNSLLPAIIACKYNGKTYNIGDYDMVFMYVKDYCIHSKNAARMATENCDLVFVFDVIHNRFVDPLDFNAKVTFQSPCLSQLIQAYTVSTLNTDTVPQVFVKVQGGWYWVGGEDDFTAYNRTERMPSSFQDLKI
jgi:hypothetical protein